MQVLAHTGPNWNPGALDTSLDLGLVAIGSRTTVLLYDGTGRFVAEIRAVGRGRVTALRFCRAPALTHLLAVGTADGFVRIFDVQARRIFRRVQEPQPGDRKGAVFAIRFIERFPNVILVASSPNKLSCWRYEAEEKANLIADRLLNLHDILCLECIPRFPNLIIVAGVEKDESKTGVVVVFDLSGNRAQYVLHRGCLIHDVAIKLEFCGETNFEVLMVLVGAAFRYPVLLKTTDGLHWKSAKSSEDENCNAAEQASIAGRVGPASKGLKTGEYHCSTTWCGHDLLLTSDGKGAITLWKMEHTRRFVEKATRQSAHVRQLFSMKPLQNDKEFVSISMDRTLAAWFLVDVETSEPGILLKWRSLRTTGPVKALALSRTCCGSGQVSGSHAEGQTAQNMALSFTCADNAVTCIDVQTAKEKSFVLGEVRPFGATVGKRKRENICRLSACNLQAEAGVFGPHQTTNFTVFGASDGRVGFIRPLDGQLEFVSSKRQRAKSNARGDRSINLIASDTEIVLSIANNGDLNQWKIPSSDESWKELRMKSFAPQHTLSILDYGSKPSRASAAYPIKSRNGKDYVLVIGYEDGQLALFSLSGECVLGPLTTKLAKVTSIAYHRSSSVVAVSDVNGSIGTFLLDWSQFEKSCLGPTVTDQHAVRVYKVLAEAITCVMWAAEPLDGTCHTSDEGTFLTTVSEQGSVSVWIYCENSSFKLRSELRGHSGSICSVAWFSSDVLLTAGEDGTIRKWDIGRQPWPRISTSSALTS